MAGNLYQRYVWLLETIKSYNGITFKQIDEAWQRSCLNDDGTPLPKRTLHNHIEAIEEMFNMHIVCHKQGGYKYYIEGAEGGKLSNTQKALLGHLQLSNTLLDNKMNRYIEFANSDVYDTIHTLTEAIRNKRYVNLSWTNGEYGSRTIKMAPFYLKQFGDVCISWFVVGELESGEDVVFNLNKISELSICDKQFVHPEISYIEFFDSKHIENRPAKDTDDSLDLSWGQLSEDGELDALFK